MARVHKLAQVSGLCDEMQEARDPLLVTGFCYQESRRSMGDWRKSSFSGGNGGACVEVASASGIMVRDTTQRDGVTIAFSTSAWETFLAALR